MKIVSRHFASILPLFFISLFCVSAVHIQTTQAQSPPSAAIATAHPFATDAGEEILRAGGNAFDAAVAITAALAVVEPYSSGIGGGGFWLLHRAEDGKQTMIDGREVAPMSADKDMYLDKNGNVIKGASINGPKAAGIPGVPAGLEHLAKNYGRLPLEKSLAPAIRFAEEGFPVTERYRKLTAYRLETMKSFRSTANIFLENDQIPSLGYNIIQKDLAKTLRRIAKQGVSYFYTGALARRMTQGSRSRGGQWSDADLANYKVIERQPVVSQYKNLRIISAPPPSSGGIVLAQIFGMLEKFDLDALDHNQRKHVVIEAMRRAYRDRAAYLGDPDFVDISEQRLLDKNYLDGLAVTIDLDHATPSSALGDIPISQQTGTNTTHFSVIDKEGNRVSATLSINLPFGSGFVVPGTGVLLNNEMDDFSAKAQVPNAYGLVGDQANAIAAGKRPLSSMSPTFIETDDRVGILGTPGGSRIISMVLLGILDFADGNLPSSWVTVPRYHHQYLPDEVQFEQGALTLNQQRELKNRGHVLNEKNRAYGNMQAILWDKKINKLFAASDPRGEGRALVITP
ncbi:MAG: gamma-glutamyltranspeptidase/glutathione hydrolase [Gammaproteobacteria bacterium]|jgi:gamma-glutamyltranspeptidase/glutathione hydrolase